MRKRKIAGWTAGVGLGLVLLALVGVLLLGRTEWGTSQVGERAIAYLDGMIAGDLRVGSVTGGGILRGVMLHDILVEDSLGRPVLSADSARLAYAVRSFLGGDVVLSRIEIWAPDVVLERLPGDSVWNFERAFADPQPDTADDKPESTDPLVLLERAVVHGGTVVIRMPWEPDEDEPVEPSDTANLILEQEPGGLVRVVRLENLNAEFPRILISSPDGEGRLFRIANVSTRAYVWETPIELERLGGTIAIRDSLLSFDIGDLRMPDTRLSGVGQVVMGDSMTFDLELDVDRLSLSDFQWLYDDMPPEGEAEGRIRVQRRVDGSTAILARDLDLNAPGTRVRGDFGVILGDTLSFTDVDLHADPLDLDFIGSLIPGGLPVEGLIIGDVRIEGPISSLRTEGDVRLVDGGRSSSVRWEGTIDARPGWAVRDFEATFTDVDPALIARFTPHESLNPTHPVSGTLTATGSRDGRLVIAGGLDLAGADEPIGHVDATVTIDGPNARRVDVDMTASDFALDQVARWVPALSVLKGRASGPVHLVLDGERMTIDADLTPQGGGHLALDGVIAREKLGGFALAGTMTDVQLGEVIEALPVSRATGSFGIGAQPGSARATIVAHIADGNFARLPIREARIAGFLEEGVLHIDSTFAQTAAGRLVASGTIGVDSTSTGSLRVRVVGDSLGAIGPMLGLSDTLMSGSGIFEGVLTGNTRALTIEGGGRLGIGHIGAYAATSADYAGTMRWTRGSRPALETRVAARGATLAERRLGDLTLQLAVDSALRGHVDLAVHTPHDQRYEAVADFAAHGDTTDLFLERVLIADGAESWTLARGGVVRMGPTGSRVQSLALVESAGGRVELAGFIPWRAPWAAESSAPARAVDLLGDIRQAPIGALVRLADPESSLRGIANGRLRIEGTADSPLMSADGNIVALRYHDVVLDTLQVRLRHQDHVSFWEIDAKREGRDMLTGHVSLPIQVAFAPFRVQRLALPMNGRIRADVMPAALPAGLVSGLERVRGQVSGELILGGTPFEPELAGGFILSDGDFTLAANNVRYTNVAGSLTVTGTQDIGVDLRATTSGGPLHVFGSIRLDVPEDPAFALRLEASNMVVARRRDLEAVATGYADLTGRFRSPRVEGRMLIVDGALYLDELIRQTQVVSFENPLLTDVIDTTQISVQRLVRENRSAFLEGLSLRIAIDVPGNFWVRSEELNVETAGNIDMLYDPAAHNLQMFGQVNAVRGFYNVRAMLDLPVRRFQVREGSISFLGVPGINPNLDITAVYRARTQSNDLLEILALVDGTLRNPRVRLTSESDPPISESDLASYLLFGRPTYALSSGESQILGQSRIGGAIASGAIGFGAPVLFGFAASEIESLGSEYGLFDYFSITNDEFAQQLQASNAGAGAAGLLAGTRFEVGRYLSDELFLAFSAPLTPFGQTATGDEAAWTPGGRVEWRFHPTWNAQVFWENRLAQAATRGFDPTLQTHDAVGVFLAREWGY